MQWMPAKAEDMEYKAIDEGRLKYLWGRNFPNLYSHFEISLSYDMKVHSGFSMLTMSSPRKRRAVF